MESNYKKLEVWKKSIILCKEIYITTQSFPKIETYGLSDQMRRSSVSISSNIAEGSGRGSNADYVRFLYISKGSLNELETQVHIAYELCYIDIDKKVIIESKIEEVLKMITGLIKSKI